MLKAFVFQKQLAKKTTTLLLWFFSLFLTQYATKLQTSQSGYERNEVFPSIDTARKIADILDTSLDYLTGKNDIEMDKITRKRILEVSKFNEDDKLHIFSVIDAFIAKMKIQSIL